MWRRNAVFACVALFAASGPAGAEESTQPTSFGKLVYQKNWATFDLVLGRLSALELRLGQSRSATVGEPQGDCSESFTMRLNQGVPSIRYQLQTATQALSIQFASTDSVEIVQTPRGTSSLKPLRYLQVPGQDVVLEIGEEADVYSAPSLWHLLLAEREVCEQHLLPILEILHPNWRLVERIERIEEQLVDEASRNAEDSLRPRIALLVHQLGDPDFQTRRKAFRELQTLGPAALCTLRRADPLRLDAEQKLRLEHICDALTPRTQDTPQRVATWLRDDETLWVGLLRHPSADVREVAFERLLHLHGRPLDFNPEAEPHAREEQLARIHDRLGLTY